MRAPRTRLSITVAATAAMVMALTPSAGAHPDNTGTDDDPAHAEEHADDVLHPIGDLSGPLAALDASTSDDLVSPGPSAKVTKNLGVAGRGERMAPDGTTDVWALGNYAYLGTFASPCGTGAGYVDGGPVTLQQDLTGPGVPIFDVENKTKPTYIGSIPSVAGSRINDVKVMSMNQGDVLVHSNESCAGGPGGFEVYNVDDPHNPVHLAHVQTDDVNDLTREGFGFVDHGVHNNYLFSRDGRDYNAVMVEGLIGDFQVIDITDPTAPWVASYYTAADVEFPGIDWVTAGIGPVLDANSYLGSGFGASQNRFLHDHYVTDDGTQAYLANWDAGLILVDLGDLDGSLASLVSVALETTSEDGEVNSHSVWPTADQKIVVEGEEDFSPFGVEFSISSGPDAGPIPGGEFGWTVPIVSEYDDRTLNGPTVYGGLGCTPGDPGIPDPSVLGPLAAGEEAILVLQRGACFFSTKVETAQAAGYDAVIIPNHHTGASDGGAPDAMLCGSQGHAFDIQINALCTGHRAMHLLFGQAPTYSGDDAPAIGTVGERVEAAANPNGWSGLRIWDYSDPANPVLASTFNTPCSADPLHETCQEGGTYSSHNVIVEGTKAYVSWYSEGLLVIDVSDPYNPVEVGRYHERGEGFEARNGGIQDIWGVYKIPDEPWVYASDRNGGLYVLKEWGSGSAKKGKGKIGG